MYGSKISLIRNARGYSQEYVATKLGIAQNTYWKIEKNEKGNIDNEMLDKIAEILGVSSDDIKSPNPIVVSFNNSPYNAPFGRQNNYINEKVVEQLVTQLKVKDEIIAKLLTKVI